MVAQWNNPRDIAKRIYIQGNLQLETPAHFGCGDAEGLLDMSLMRDAYSGKILLSGSSLAGALRGYLTQLNKHYADKASFLFGDVKGKKSFESLLIIEDAISEAGHIEVRDGVSISPVSGTAVNQAKYDIELLSAGAFFRIGFELLLPQNGGEEELEVLTIALHGLESGAISLGKRKRRGFGRCKVSEWQIWTFDVDHPTGLLQWLENWPLKEPHREGTRIDQLLLKRELLPPELDSDCVLEAQFSLESPLLIRANPDLQWDSKTKRVAESPDKVHLHSLRRGALRPVVSGTSLAGVLRSRTMRICSVLGLDGEAWTEGLFGGRKKTGEQDGQLKGKKTWKASRFWVDEIELSGPLEDDLVQSRVMIDRFTGGAQKGKLFSEQPVFPMSGNRLTLKLRIQPVEHEGEIALLLLLLKDLWAGDLPVGGESGVGRGRLRGISAKLTYGKNVWMINSEAEDILKIDGDIQTLNNYLKALRGVA